MLAASDQGSLIVNRFDYRPAERGSAIGVGFQILDGAAYDPEEVDQAKQLLTLRRRHFGDGVIAIDGGANIGVHTVEWARHMSGWGSVVAIEAQERIFYALAGNIALNNCANARAVHAALAAEEGVMHIPAPDYLLPGSFGSLELQQKPTNEFIGQPIDYSAERLVPVRRMTLDAIGLERVDLIKLDIEGMEEEALTGAQQLIANYHPMLMVEWIKSAKAALCTLLEAAGYRLSEVGMNLLAVHTADPSLPSLTAVRRVGTGIVGSPDPGQAPRTANPPPPTAAAMPPGTQLQTYSPPPELFTQEGPRGIHFDFNDGCRVALPPADHPWQVRLSDIYTGNLLYETTIPAGIVKTNKRYWLRARLEVAANGEAVFAHDWDAADREVLVQFPSSTLGIGDTIGWFSYVPRFQQAHRCRLTCAMQERAIPLFRDAYPEINFVTHEQNRPDRYYATYNVGLGFVDEGHDFQPCDYRQVGLHRSAAYILGVDQTETPPRIALPSGPRPFAEPYACIAVQSTRQCKYWNNPAGWDEIVAFLKERGYRVVCIDQKPVHGEGLVQNRIPRGAEDMTGDRPLLERALWLRHADLFVGLSSGLSWLAWAVGVPVVLISGFTHPINEFATPYRVINWHVCNSCWNDPRLRFDHHDFFWCPRQKGTPRQFECTRLITAAQVKTVIERIPGFATGRPP